MMGHLGCVQTLPLYITHKGVANDPPVDLLRQNVTIVMSYLGRQPHIKKDRLRCLSEILKRTPKIYQGPVLWVWLEMFSPLRGTSSKTKHYHYLLLLFSQLNTLKSSCGTSKAEYLEKHPKESQIIEWLGARGT